MAKSEDDVVYPEVNFLSLLSCFNKIDDWKKLAPFLLNDEDGVAVKKISQDHKDVSNDCCQEMIREYVKSGEKTWNHVLKCLRHSGYKNIANDMEKEFKTPLEFTIPPTPQNVELNKTAKFTCSATGYNVKFQWTNGSGPFWTKVTGTESSTLVIPDVKSSDAITYTCTISDGIGRSVTSDSVKLTVTGLPEVIVDPPSQSVEVGGTAKFTAKAKGIGKKSFTYQWKHNGEDMKGETKDTLTIHVTEDKYGMYQCVVKNEYKDVDKSKAAELKEARKTSISEGSGETKPPVITTHPIDKEFFIENNNECWSLTCQAEGAETYLWEKEGGSIPKEAKGVDKSTLTLVDLKPAHSGNYRCFACKGSHKIPSDFAIFSVKVKPPKFTSHPESATVQLGQTVIFSCHAIGYDVEYKWIIEKRMFPSTASGMDTNTLKITDVKSSDATTYSCTINNDKGNTLITSHPATLTVTGQPKVTVDPSSERVKIASSVKFTTTVRGVGKFTYQWRRNGVEIDEETRKSLTIKNVATNDQGDYDCVVCNEYDDKVASNKANLVVYSLPKVTVDPSSNRVEIGGTVKFTATVSGVGENFSYQWRHNNSDIEGGTGIHLTINDVTKNDQGNYDCVVCNEYEDKVTSNKANLVVYSLPKVTVGPSSNRVEIGGTVKFTATVSDVVEKFRYQWRQNNVEIDRATSSTYTIKKVKERHQGDYDCIVCNEYEEKVASNKANLVVYIQHDFGNRLSRPGSSQSSKSPTVNPGNTSPQDTGCINVVFASRSSQGSRTPLIDPKVDNPSEGTDFAPPKSPPRNPGKAPVITTDEYNPHQGTGGGNQDPGNQESSFFKRHFKIWMVAIGSGMLLLLVVLITVILATQLSS